MPACLGTAGNLEVLDISWNSIKWLGLTDKPFWNGRHLRSLTIHHNGLEALPEFHSDSGLREMDFHSNRVRIIPQSLFKLPKSVHPQCLTRHHPIHNFAVDIFTLNVAFGR